MSRKLALISGAALVGLALIAIVLGIAATERQSPIPTPIPIPVKTQGLWADGHIFHTDAVTNANGTVMDVWGYPVVGVQIEGITVATVNFEATVDGTNYDPIQAMNTETGAMATTATADAQFIVATTGKASLRCRISGYSSGTIDITGLGEVQTAPVNLADVDIDDISKGTQTNDVAITLDSESVDVTTSVDFTVTLDSEAVDVTTSVDFTVTLDSEVVTADVTGQGDVPITLDSEAVDVTTSVDFTVTLDSEVVTVDSELPAAAALADAVANPTVPKVGSADLLFNNTTWDRERNNYQVTAYASATYTVSQWVELINYNARGAYIVVNITSIGTNQTMTVKASVDDDASSQMDTIWASAALTPTGRHSYLIYPGAGAAAEDVVETVSYPLPRNWNLSVLFNNSEPIVFSIGVHYIN